MKNSPRSREVETLAEFLYFWELQEHLIYVKCSFISKPIWIELLQGIFKINWVIPFRDRKTSHMYNVSTQIEILWFTF